MEPTVVCIFRKVKVLAIFTGQYPIDAVPIPYRPRLWYKGLHFCVHNIIITDSVSNCKG